MLEIDILPASTESKGADSILIRFGTFDYKTFSNNQKVILIDGGYQDTANLITKHLTDWYRTDTIDLLINTHPDKDHISGLVALLDNKEIKIKKALVHNPWDFKYSINRKSRDNRTTPDSIGSRLEESLSLLDDLLSKLEERTETKVESPFAEHEEFDGIIKFLGPTKDFYIKKVTEFPGMLNYKDPKPDFKLVDEVYNINMNHFIDEPETSARNSSSTIFLFKYDGVSVLFTGDAGCDALNNSIDFANQKSIALNNLNYFQIPHHGSIKNLSKEITEKIKSRNCFVSAPYNSDKHPSNLITNYFQTVLKSEVYHVSKLTLRISSNNTPPRGNWSKAATVPVFEKVKVPSKNK
jgi:beta-lactamase superfamily II metal-dependent hydrolase